MSQMDEELGLQEVDAYRLFSFKTFREDGYKPVTFEYTGKLITMFKNEGFVREWNRLSKDSLINYAIFEDTFRHCWYLIEIINFSVDLQNENDINYFHELQARQNTDGYFGKSDHICDVKETVYINLDDLYETYFIEDLIEKKNGLINIRSHFHVAQRYFKIPNEYDAEKIRLRCI